MKSIILYGAFDRYNYGDVLFPIIFNKFIENYHSELRNEYKIEYVSLEAVNLEGVDGVKTKSINEFINTAEDGSAVIVVGGETLTAKLNNLYLDSLNSFIQVKCEKKINNYLPKYIEKKAIKKYGFDFPFPYTLNPTVFKNKINIGYNSIGAGGYSYLSTKEREIIDKNIKCSKYFSVRDKNSFSLINKISDTSLSPDSATLMSEFYDYSILDGFIGEKIREFSKNKYIILQLGYWKSKDYLNEIINQIKLIKSKHNINILLLPIGFATNHDDLIILRKIKDILKDEVHLFEELKIFEIMYLIAKSQFFFGTSLHGNITAMSFGVPYAGLNKEIIKLDQYLKSWGIEPFDRNITFNEIAKFYNDNNGFDRNKLLKNANKLKEMVKENNTKLLNSVLRCEKNG